MGNWPFLTCCIGIVAISAKTSTCKKQKIHQQRPPQPERGFTIDTALTRRLRGSILGGFQMTDTSSSGYQDFFRFTPLM